MKFNILGSEINATPIADITFDMTCLKIPAKGYTYNGKTQKPKVTVKGADGKKLKSSEFKVIYSGNVNAGLAKVQIVGLYNKKKNTGYYGVSEPYSRNPSRRYPFPPWRRFQRAEALRASRSL